MERLQRRATAAMRRAFVEVAAVIRIAERHRAWVFVCAVSAACTMLAAAASADTVAGHLYISSGNDAYYMNWETGATVSYALEGGRIGVRPDHIYPTNTQGPMAVDAAGDLYASMAVCTITVYAHDSTQVVRTLNVGPGTSGCVGYNLYDAILGITLDDRGYLYVGMAWEGNGSVKARSRSARLPPAQSTQCDLYECMYVYAPNASGNATPVQSFSVSTAGGGMSTDHAGNLYLEGGDSIIVIGHPLTNPKQVRSIRPKGFSGISNPHIVDGSLYAEVSQCGDNFYPCKNSIGVFPSGANGIVAPQRSFLEPYHELWNGFSIWGGSVYVLTEASVIQVFDEQAQGEAMPLFSQILYPQPAYPTFEVIGK